MKKLTANEAAERLETPVYTIRKWCRDLNEGRRSRLDAAEKRDNKWEISEESLRRIESEIGDFI